jgi:hypothetical protein
MMFLDRSNTGIVGSNSARGMVALGCNPKVSGLATWSENCKWYSSLPLGAVVSLFCQFCPHNPSYYFSTSVCCCCCCCCCLFRYDSVRKLLDIPSYVDICLCYTILCRKGETRPLDEPTLCQRSTTNVFKEGSWFQKFIMNRKRPTR